MEFEACCQWVSQKMAGIQYKESHYQNLLAHKLQKEGWIVSSEQNLTYELEGCVLGFGRLDLVIEKKKKIHCGTETSSESRPNYVVQESAPKVFEIFYR